MVKSTLVRLTVVSLWDDNVHQGSASFPRSSEFAPISDGDLGWHLALRPVESLPTVGGRRFALLMRVAARQGRERMRTRDGNIQPGQPRQVPSARRGQRTSGAEIMLGRVLAHLAHPWVAWRVCSTPKRFLMLLAYSAVAYVTVLSTLLARSF